LGGVSAARCGKRGRGWQGVAMPLVVPLVSFGFGRGHFARAGPFGAMAVVDGGRPSCAVSTWTVIKMRVHSRCSSVRLLLARIEASAYQDQTRILS